MCDMNAVDQHVATIITAVAGASDAPAQLTAGAHATLVSSDMGLALTILALAATWLGAAGVAWRHRTAR